MQDLEGKRAKPLPAPEEVFRLTVRAPSLDHFNASQAQAFDVILLEGSPLLSYQQQFHPACGHWLWEDQHPAEVICRKQRAPSQGKTAAADQRDEV